MLLHRLRNAAVGNIGYAEDAAAPHLVKPYFELLVTGARNQGKQGKLLHG